MHPLCERLRATSQAPRARSCLILKLADPKAPVRVQVLLLVDRARDTWGPLTSYIHAAR